MSDLKRAWITHSLPSSSQDVHWDQNQSCVWLFSAKLFSPLHNLQQLLPLRNLVRLNL